MLILTSQTSDGSLLALLCAVAVASISILWLCQPHWTKGDREGQMYHQMESAIASQDWPLTSWLDHAWEDPAKVQLAYSWHEAAQDRAYWTHRIQTFLYHTWPLDWRRVDNDNRNNDHSDWCGVSQGGW